MGGNNVPPSQLNLSNRNDDTMFNSGGVSLVNGMNSPSRGFFHLGNGGTNDDGPYFANGQESQGREEASSQPPAAKKKYPTVPTTEKCLVCSEPAAKHMHYGAITCFSCKAFFRRAVQNNAANDFICRANDDCDIAIQSRKHCQKCRYQRCIKIGMKPGWVLSKAERQKRFKGRKPKEPHQQQPQQQQQQQQPAPEEVERDQTLSTIKMEPNPSPPEMELVECCPSTWNNLNESSSSSPQNAAAAEDKIEEVNEETNATTTATAATTSCISNFPKELIMNDCEVAVLVKLAGTYDRQYASVAFGETLLKEMIVCSFGVPISPRASLALYRLVLERVTKVAQGLEHFGQLSGPVQEALLKKNADLMVCIQCAAFFDNAKGGFEQLMASMGQDDLEFGKQMVQKFKSNVSSPIPASSLGRIDYANFNSIQELEDKEQEERFAKLLVRIGKVVAHNPTIMKMLSYIVLFSLEDQFDCPSEAQLAPEHVHKVESRQHELIKILERGLNCGLVDCKKVGNPVILFANTLGCISDLRELSHINKRRTFRSEAKRALDQTNGSDSIPMIPKTFLF